MMSHNHLHSAMTVSFVQELYMPFCHGVLDKMTGETHPKFLSVLEENGTKEFQLASFPKGVI